MPALLIYLLKVNAALLLFCLGYYGVLRKLTFYTLNRVYLITAILFSSLYPAINIDSLLQRHEKLSAPLQPIQVVVIDFSDRVTQIAQPAAQTNYWQWIVMLFWAGVVVMAFRLAAQFWSLFRIYKQSEPAQLYNQPVRVINEEANPFSFWQSIYINPKHHAEGELRSIIAHEQIHVKQWHTLDILLAEVSLVFYWFNPGVWLMKKAVAENLEFITDRKILQQGIDAKSYQYSLLYASLNTSPNAMVNHFNISTIKKRIMMMNSKRSSRFGLARYGFIAPIMIALLLVFGTSKAAFIKNTINKVQTATNAAIKDLGLTQPNTQQTESIIADANAGERQTEKIILHQATLNIPIEASGIDTPKIKITPKLSSMGTDSVLYILDGKALNSKADFQKINMSEIQSVDILKNIDAIKLFGDAGYKGAVVITSKAAANNAQMQLLQQKINEIRVANGQKALSTNMTGTVSINANSTKADTSLKPTGYYIDAKTTAKIPLYGNPNETLALLGPVRTNSATVSELVRKRDSINKALLRAIGEESAAKNGRLKDVVVVGYGTKSNSNITIKGKGGQPEPLWVVDGKEMPLSPLNELNPNSIETITVLKDASATALYGAKGVNGVILVTTKKGSKSAPKKN